MPYGLAEFGAAEIAVPPGTIAAPEGPDARSVTGFLSQIDGVLSSIPVAIQTVSSDVFDRVVRDAPQLKNGAALTAHYATDIADAALVSFADKMLEALPSLGVNEDTINSISEGLSEFWRVDAQGRPYKVQGGGGNFLRRVISSDPRFAQAAQRSLNRLGVTRLYDSLNKTSKVMLWLGALGTYAATANLVRPTATVIQESDPVRGVRDVTVEGVSVNVPGVGMIAVDALGLKRLNAEIAGQLARVGVRARPVSATLRVDHRRSGDSTIRTGVSVPIARRSRMELGIGTTRSSRDVGPMRRDQSPSSWELNLSAGVSAPISPTSQIMARAGIETSINRRREFASNPSITLGLSGPLPTFSARVNQDRRAQVRRANERDEMAQTIVSRGAIDPQRQGPYTYRQLVGKPYEEVERIFLSSSRSRPTSSSSSSVLAKNVSNTKMRGSRAKNICMRWVDYYRTYRQGQYSPDWYSVYENADAQLQDECARHLSISMEIDAYKRNRNDPKELSRLRNEFNAHAESNQLPGVLANLNQATARAQQISASDRRMKQTVAKMGAVRESRPQVGYFMTQIIKGSE